MSAALMIQGTGSDVGKSLIVAGFARAFANRGLRVRPFKPQNMSNNAAVTADGGEIGRAQALQARAARVDASVHMNPVLLKPQSEVGSQVVVQGKVLGNYRARDYQGLKPRLMQAVQQSFAHLRAEADLVLVEGAGSASEINLRRNDIANMGFARACGVPVVLVGDIDRGGVFAQIVGTKAVIDPADAATIAGFIVNRFRGDPSLFGDGMALIERRTGWRALGLVPHFADARRLPAEDALALDHARETNAGSKTIVVPVLPHIANFDDLDPLDGEDDLTVLRVRTGPLPVCDCILLPGSKATLADLAAFRANGWDVDLLAHARRGGRVVGICGGYQMLGRIVRDSRGIEGPPGEAAGLALLDVETELTTDKSLLAVTGRSIADDVAFSGYEMHVGVTAGPDAARPVLRFADGRTDGAMSCDGRVIGHYVHGLFNGDAQRRAFVECLGATPSSFAYDAEIDTTLDGLAAHLERHLDLDALLAIARGGKNNIDAAAFPDAQSAIRDPEADSAGPRIGFQPSGEVENPETIAHGGGVHAARRAFPDAPEPWIDLSTGINPHAWPIGGVSRESWTRLPEAEDIAALEAVAARAYGAGDPVSLVAAPGAQSLIQLLPRLHAARDVAVLGPTYAEHAHRWRRGGAQVREIASLDDIGDADVVVIVNPNNPDGRLFDADALAPLARSLTDRGALLVLDESFMDVAPDDASFVLRIGTQSVVVMRSFGKFYGLAGLRLGFALAPPALAARLRDALGPWAVSGAAVEIGLRALADRAWRDTMRVRLADHAARLDRLLSSAGLTIVGGTSLFRLAETSHASTLAKALAARGILVRTFADAPTRLRFGLPGGDEQWARLARALEESNVAKL